MGAATAPRDPACRTASATAGTSGAPLRAPLCRPKLTLSSTHSTAVPAGETLTHVITVEEDERITFSGVSDLPLTLYAKKDACPTATDYDFTVTTFGSDNDYSIETGCDNEAHMTAGNWYVMAEQAQGGESKMQGKGSVSSCKSTLSFILIGAGAIVAIAIIGIIIAAVFVIRKKKNGSRY